MEKDAFTQACREGGAAIAAALVALDRSYFATLYRDSLRMLRDPDVARDLVQETFIKVWQRCASFHGDSELLPWIRAILRHAIVDRLRRPDREVPLQEAEDMSPAVTRRIAELSWDRVPTPYDDAHRRQLAECFERCWRAFEAACPAHAAALTWIVEDGLDNEQLAELLGRTPGATREFISQCRKRARLYLREWYEQAFGLGETA